MPDTVSRRRPRARWAGLILLALGCGLMAGTSAGAAPDAERLVLEPYPATPAWREVTHKAVGAKFLIEQIPSDQVVEDYRDILTAQSFPELRGRDPSDFLKGIFARSGRDCEGVRVNGPKAQTEGGSSVAYGQIYCGRQRGKSFGVRMFFKVIAGRDALYVVQRESRVPASEVGGVQTFSKDQLAAAVAMMNAAGVANRYLVESVYLCGGASTEPRCEHPSAS